MLREWGVLRTAERSVWVSILVWAPLAFAYFGIQAVLLNLYLVRLGFGLEFIGLLIGSGQLLWAALALPAGAIGRRFGLRKVLILAGSLHGTGMALFVLVEGLPRAIWEPAFILSWMVLWTGAALFAVNSTPYLMQVAAERERNYAFSAVSAVMVVAGFVGSVVAGYLPGACAAWFGGGLEQAGPYRCALSFTPPIYLLSAFIWAMGRPVEVRDEDETTGQARNLPLALFLVLGVVAFLQTATEGAVRSFFNVYLDTGLQVPVEQIGVVLGAAQFISLLGVVVTPRLFGRLGTARAMAVVSVGAALVLLPVAGVAALGVAAAGFIAAMTLASVNAIGRSVFSQEIVSPRWRTTSSAIATIGLAVGWAASAAAGGYVIRFTGFSGLFLLAVGLSVGAAVLLAAHVRRQGQMAEGESSAQKN